MTRYLNLIPPPRPYQIFNCCRITFPFSLALHNAKLTVGDQWTIGNTSIFQPVSSHQPTKF